MAKGTIIEHTESALAAVFGLSLPDLRNLREFLVEGQHWYQKGRGIIYSQEGREQLQIALDLADGVAVAEPETLDLVVFRACKNPRMVIAFDAAKKERLVLVRNNAGCRRGMTLKGCKPVNEGLWKFNGHIKIS